MTHVDPPLIEVLGLSQIGNEPKSEVGTPLSLSVSAGEALAIVGPDLGDLLRLLLSPLGLLSGRTLTVRADEIRYFGNTPSPRTLGQGLLGRKVGVVLPEQGSALDPAATIGELVTAGARQNLGLKGSAAQRHGLGLLEQVGVAAPKRMLSRYPSQLSRGMRQRIALAMALSAEPSLLVLASPTANLDRQMQQALFTLLTQLRRETQLGLVLVSNDLEEVRELADRVLVTADAALKPPIPIKAFSTSPAPFICELRRAERSLQEVTPPPARQEGEAPLLAASQLTHLYKEAGGFLRKARYARVITNLSLAIRPGETLALVGESGCGKSVLARLLTRTEAPTFGQLNFDETLATGLGRRASRGQSLAPRWLDSEPTRSQRSTQTVFNTIAEGLADASTTQSATRRDLVIRIIRLVGLLPQVTDRLCQELSTSERQQVNIGRALIANPKLVICDEPLAFLDARAQLKVLGMLLEHQKKHNTAYLVFTHSLPLARRLAHRLAVMYAGRLVETGPTADVLRQRRHPYTRAFFAASASDEAAPRLQMLLEGAPPDPVSLPSGCPFHPRCPQAEVGVCDRVTPSLVQSSPDSPYATACHHPL